jgi:hypothetical protein
MTQPAAQKRNRVQRGEDRIGTGRENPQHRHWRPRAIRLRVRHGNGAVRQLVRRGPAAGLRRAGQKSSQDQMHSHKSHAAPCLLRVTSASLSARCFRPKLSDHPDKHPGWYTRVAKRHETKNKSCGHRRLRNRSVCPGLFIRVQTSRPCRELGVLVLHDRCSRLCRIHAPLRLLSHLLGASDVLQDRTSQLGSRVLTTRRVSEGEDKALPPNIPIENIRHAPGHEDQLRPVHLTQTPCRIPRRALDCLRNGNQRFKLCSGWTGR